MYFFNNLEIIYDFRRNRNKLINSQKCVMQRHLTRNICDWLSSVKDNRYRVIFKIFNHIEKILSCAMDFKYLTHNDSQYIKYVYNYGIHVHTKSKSYMKLPRMSILYYLNNKYVIDFYMNLANWSWLNEQYLYDKLFKCIHHNNIQINDSEYTIDFNYNVIHIKKI